MEEKRPVLLPALFIWLTCLIASVSVRGEWHASTDSGADAPFNLTLDTAIAMALENSSDMQRAGFDTASAAINADHAARAFHPSMSFSGSTSARWSEPAVSGGDDVTQSATLRLGSAYTLFNGFSDSANRDAALLELAGTAFAGERVRETVVFMVISRFLDAASALEQIRVQEENLVAQKELLLKINAFYEAGKRPVADLYQQQAEVASAEYRLLSVQRDFELKKLALLDQIGIESLREVAIVSDGLDALHDAMEPPDDPVQAAAVARENRLDYKAARASLEAQANSLRAARGGYWPELGLSMDAGTSWSSMSDASWSDQMGSDNPYASIGLSIGLPLYDRRQTRNAVATAELGLKRAELARQDLERQLDREILTAHLEYGTARKQLESAVVRINYTRQALENYEQRYTVNAATLLEVIQARASHLNALYEKIAAEYNLIGKAVAMRYYTGGPGRLHDVTASGRMGNPGDDMKTGSRDGRAGDGYVSGEGTEVVPGEVTGVVSREVTEETP